MKVLLEIESLDMPDNEENRNHVREVVQKCLDQQFCKELKIPVKFTTWTATLKVRELANDTRK